MKSSPPLKEPARVGEVLRERLRDTKRSPEELAEAAQVPVAYINDLITGRRRPPLPGRTDVYERMTSFLRLSRNDLAICAQAERRSAAAAAAQGPAAEVMRRLFTLCEPLTARELKRRRGRSAGTELAALTQRLLDVIQGTVRRNLDDQIGLRVAAADQGTSYVSMRFRLLEFLDVTPDTLTMDDLERFLVPRIRMWDVDLQTGVLRVVLRTQEPQDRTRRRPAVRSHFSSRG